MKLSRLIWMLVAVTVMLIPAAVFADEQQPADIGGDMFPSLLKLVGAMVVIMALIYGSVWLMKRFSHGKLRNGGNLISIVERRHLSPKQAVYLLRVGDQHILVGASDSGINKISEVVLSEEPEAPVAPHALEQTSRFSQVLRQARDSFTSSLRVKRKSAEVES